GDTDRAPGRHDASADACCVDYLEVFQRRGTKPDPVDDLELLRTLDFPVHGDGDCRLLLEVVQGLLDCLIVIAYTPLFHGSLPCVWGEHHAGRGTSPACNHELRFSGAGAPGTVTQRPGRRGAPKRAEVFPANAPPFRG